MQQSSRDQHEVYCENNESVRVEMPKHGSTVEFKDGQNQFKDALLHLCTSAPYTQHAIKTSLVIYCNFC